jgi:galactokinase/mevalonate kinase-like predicted kinase
MDTLECDPALIVEHTIQVISQDLDEDNASLANALIYHGKQADCIDAIVEFLMQSDRSKDTLILLKQERGIMLTAEILFQWRLLNYANCIGFCATHSSFLLNALAVKTEIKASLRTAIFSEPSENPEFYLDFMEPFLMASNDRELMDFELCSREIFDSLSSQRILSWNSPSSSSSGMWKSSSPMRFSISSANASDNWTNAKLRGGKVLNISVDLNSRNPLSVSLSRFDHSEPVLVLVSSDSLSGTFSTTTSRFTSSNIGDLLVFRPSDPFRMLKYSLFFTNILKTPEEYYSSPLDIFKDLKQFCGFNGLQLELRNEGPSRSGFASSSAVSMNLLNALYAASGQHDLCDDLERLGTMALLFENRLGLKSGRQDVDGLLRHGARSLDYPRSSKFLVPKIDHLPSLKHDILSEFILLVDSGVQRSSTLGRSRGLNMRHFSLLTRNPANFHCIKKSYGVHDAILNALESSNFSVLGQLFTAYMGLRETIDPGATSSIFDSVAGFKVLKLLFDPLIEKGLIYGGMFTGAMGGGVAMIVLCPGKKPEVLEQLDSLKRFELSDGQKPFEKLDVFRYSINLRGIFHEYIPS